MEVLEMLSTEHRELVMQLYERNKETFRIITRVLTEQSPGEAQTDGMSLKGIEDDNARRQAESLTPQSLIDGAMNRVLDMDGKYVLDASTRKIMSMSEQSRMPAFQEGALDGAATTEDVTLDT